MSRTKGPRTVYAPKEPPSKSALLTPFAKQIAEAAEARTRQGFSNIVEHLLRLHGGRITAEEFAPLPDAPAPDIVAA